MSEASNDVVLFEEVACANGMKLGVATLNTPKTLNGLSLDMTRLLAVRMEVWAKDPDQSHPQPVAMHPSSLEANSRQR